MQDETHCLEVMTGAILPEGTDTVIQYEWLDIKDGTAVLEKWEGLQEGRSIHPKGKDCPEGELLIPRGRRIGPVEIAILATVGKAEVQVVDHPKVAIIATGDELVPVAETPLPHQIRASNVHMLQGALKELFLEGDIFHLKDDREMLLVKIRKILSDYDVLLISGGVSKGKFDYIPGVLEELGIRKLFHRVRQKPGKPFWFGRGEDTFVFALPGNPISGFMCFHRYFKKWLFESLNTEKKPAYAKLKTDFTFKPELTYFLQVREERDENGEIMMVPNKGNGSGDLAGLTRSSGFLQLPSDRSEFKAGEEFPYFPF